MTPKEKEKLKIKAALAAFTGLCSNPNIVKLLNIDGWDADDMGFVACDAVTLGEEFVKQLESDEHYDD
jgi:hypothetical protein